MIRLARAALLFVLACSPSQAAVEFANPVVPACLSTQDAAAGDFNGDGIADLAATCRFTDEVVVYRADGNGTFSPWASVPVLDPVALRVADFNSDSVPDIVVAAESYIGVSLLLGNGDGTFQPPIGYPAGARPSDLVLADLDGDGQVDVVVANLGSDDLSVFHADGEGGLALVENVAVGFTQHLAAGDFDDDGTPDVVALHSGETEVFVLLGDGEGSLTEPVTVPAGGFPYDVAAGDLDNDTVPDIAVSARSSDRITVLISNGDGTFGAPVVAQQISSPGPIAVTDMDLDGDADLVVSVAVPNEIEVLRGNGDGTFANAWRAPLGGDAEAVVVADMDGNGRPDVLVPRGTSSDVSVLLGTGDGALDVPPRYAENVPSTGIGSADLDHDGYLDVVVAGNDGQDKEFAVLRGDGLGRFDVSYQAPTTSFPLDVVLERLDGDDHPDLSMTTFLGIAVLLGDGDGSFGTETTVSVEGARKHVAGRWDADRHTDLAALVEFDDEIALFFGDGSGAFGGELRIATPPQPKLFLQADLTGEGHADFLVDGFDFGSQIAILLGNGDGTFDPAPLLLLDTAAVSATVADFDEDGEQDLAVANQLERVLVFRGNGDGTFRRPVPGTSFLSGEALVAADLDGDGHVDLFSAVRGTVALLIGRGDGTFESERRFGAGRFPRSLAVGDFTGDGMPDIVAADPAGGVAVLLQRGAFLSWGADVDALRWRSVTAATAHNVYRGDLADLTDDTGDGLPDTGYGACVAQTAAGMTGWTDLERPLQRGEGFSYLVTYVSADGEFGAGHTGDGKPRALPPPCPSAAGWTSVRP